MPAIQLHTTRPRGVSLALERFAELLGDDAPGYTTARKLSALYLEVYREGVKNPTFTFTSDQASILLEALDHAVQFPDFYLPENRQEFKRLLGVLRKE